MVVVLVPLSLVPLFFGIIALVEGAIVEATIPFAVSILAASLFAFFAGKRTVSFDKNNGYINVEFRSLLRHSQETRDINQLQAVLLYEEHGESAPKLVDPNSQPRLHAVRYRAALSFQDEAELNLNGNATKGSSAHRIAQTVIAWLKSIDHASIKH